jgi:hypothetical protein
MPCGITGPREGLTYNVTGVFFYSFPIGTHSQSQYILELLISQIAAEDQSGIR